MTLVLYAIGAIVLVISILVGFSYGTFMGFLIILGAGILISALFFALGYIIENQEKILSKLAYIEESYQNFHIKQVVCPKCNLSHDNDYSSCPHCGYREI